MVPTVSVCTVDVWCGCGRGCYNLHLFTVVTKTPKKKRQGSKSRCLGFLQALLVGYFYFYSTSQEEGFQRRYVDCVVFTQCKMTFFSGQKRKNRSSSGCKHSCYIS